MATHNKKPRLVTGLTATGDLHLGSYLGTMKQWQSFADTHECYKSLLSIVHMAVCGACGTRYVRRIGLLFDGMLCNRVLE